MTSGPRGRDRGGRATGSAIPEVHCGLSALRQTRDWYRHATVRRRAVAQLTEVVQAPAVNRGCAGESAGNRTARCEGTEAQAPRDGDRRRGIRDRAVPELAACVGAPAVGRPGASEPAGVILSRGESTKAQAPGDGARRWP